MLLRSCPGTLLICVLAAAFVGMSKAAGEEFEGKPLSRPEAALPRTTKRGYDDGIIKPRFVRRRLVATNSSDIDIDIDAVAAAVSSSSSSSRVLKANPACTQPSDYFGVNDIASGMAGWLGVEGEETNFVSKMISLYVDDQVVGAKGKDIRNLDGKSTFPGACERLPLKNETCYFTKNPDKSFFETLVAEYIPFGKEIVAAKQYVDDQIENVQDTADEIYNFVLPEKDEKGSCFAINEEMVGFSENPGFPPPWIYQVCNCISLRANGVPYCTVQAYFKGFAFSLGNNALQYDVSERLGGDFKLYDGLVQYEFIPDGDIWVGLELTFAIPQLANKQKLTDAICLPSDTKDDAKPTEQKTPEITIQGSMLIKDDVGDDGRGEFLALVAMEEVTAKLKMLDVGLGSAVAVIRIRSAIPACQPSGFFFSARLKTNFGLGEGLEKYVGSILGETEAQLDFGVTWKDSGEVDADDVIQSIFMRLEISDFTYLGFQLEKTTMEIQYFDDVEFTRRRNFNTTACCVPENGITDCSIPNQPLLNFIENKGVQPQPTIGMFLKVQDLSFYQIVFFKQIELQIIFQLADLDESSTRFYFNLQVKALFVEASVEVLFESTPTGELSQFKASTTVNVGLGTLKVGVEAKAAIGDYLYDQDRRRTEAIILNDNSTELVHSRSRELLGSSFVDADWDLDFFSDWETAQWLKDLGAAIVAGLKAVWEGLKFVWNAIVDFVEDAWKAITDLAKVIGGAIAEVFDAIGEAIDGAQDAIADGVDAAVGFLNGQGPVGRIAGEALEILGDVADFTLDRLGDAVDLAAGIFRGDWKAAGQAIKNLFGFSKSVSGRTEVDAGGRDDVLNCPRRKLVWRECKRAFFVKYDCTNKETAPYPEQTCAKQKAKEVEKLKEDAELAKKQDQCKKGSEARNQGVTWAGEQAEKDAEKLREDLGAKMKETRLPIGKSSALDPTSTSTAPNAACKTVPFEVSSKTLSPSSSGLSTGKSSQSGASSSCIDFMDRGSLEPGLLTFRDEVAEAAKDMARGDQGLDKDPDAKKCGDVAGANCDVEPLLLKGPNFKDKAEVYCDIDWDTFTFEQYFGTVSLSMDSACAPKPVEWKVLRRLDNDDNKCEPATMEVERSANDCCNNPTNTFKHELTILQRPPKFTQAAKSLDATVQCDANIHPKYMGEPTYQLGCPDSVADVGFSDNIGELNKATCRTTVTRVFYLVEDECEDLQTTFTQVIELKNDYLPTWSEFPEDVVIGVFEDYGTDATGFPKAYQQCGAGPVEITYEDKIQPGSCFAERILTRTFTAEDICGHKSTKAQTITITNNADFLPLGDKSLAKVYGRDRARIANNDKLCLWPSDQCGINGAPTNYACGSASISEFSNYQNALKALDKERSLDLGTTNLSCNCAADDDSCDAITQDKALDKYFKEIIYGVKVTNNPGTCTTVYSMRKGLNSGDVHMNGVECPPTDNQNSAGGGKGKPKRNRMLKWKKKKTTTKKKKKKKKPQATKKHTKKQSIKKTTMTKKKLPESNPTGGLMKEDTTKKKLPESNPTGGLMKEDIQPATTPDKKLHESNLAGELCTQLKLRGWNEVYNLFSVSAQDLATTGIVIKAPPTSIVLIDVKSDPYPHMTNITISKTTPGIILEGIAANNVLWNAPNGFGYKLTATARADYSWKGTLLNSKGWMQMTLSGQAENEWEGQLFCDNLNANKINFECGHFAGFAACEP